MSESKDIKKTNSEDSNINDNVEHSKLESSSTGDNKKKLSGNKTDPEKLVFEKNIKYKRLSKGQTLEKLNIDSLSQITLIKKDSLFASRLVGEGVELKLSDNVKMEEDDGLEKYYATINGKIIIDGNIITLVIVDIDAECSISVIDNSLTALLTCIPSRGDGQNLSLDLVKNELKSIGIIEGLDFNKIEAFIISANESNTALDPVIIAKGKPAQKGADGKVDFTFDLNEDSPKFKLLPDGRIDYKFSSNIIVKQKGEELAKIIPPENGINGIDVFGKDIIAEKGTAKILTPGKGVDISKEGNVFLASFTGHVAMQGQILEVKQVYIVNGDVDYSSGNIDFEGDIIINGSVTEGFKVIATGNITVLKNVEAGILDSGNDIIINGGIQGKGKDKIKAEGCLKASFIQNSDVFTKSDIEVENFIVNSNINCLGNLKVLEKKGAVLGGNIHVLKDINVKVLGSESFTKTYIESGTAFVIKEELEAVNSKIKFYEENILKIEQVLVIVNKKIKEDPKILIDKKEVIVKTIEKRDNFNKELEIAKVKQQELAEKLNYNKRSFIKIEQECFPDVTIKIKNSILVVSSHLDAVRFYEDEKEGCVKSEDYVL